MGWFFSLEPGTYEWFFILLIGVSWTLSSIVFSYYVYLDSRKKRIKDREIFIMIVLLLNIIGLIFYLALRRVYPKSTLKNFNS